MADELSPESYWVGRIADLRSQGFATLGNTKRLAFDMEGARAAFEEARSWLPRGTGAPVGEAELASLEAGLLRDLGDFEGTVRVLYRAIAIHQEVGERHLEGRAWIKKAEGHALSPRRTASMTASLFSPRGILSCPKRSSSSR